MARVGALGLLAAALVAACGARPPTKGGFTRPDDPYLLGPPKRDPLPVPEGCTPDGPCPTPPLAPPPLPMAANAPSSAPGSAPAYDPLANVATLDPDAPMPKQGVSTNATLQLGQPASVMIDARSDLFSSGAAAPDPRRAGVMPAIITLAPGGGVLSFSDVRGKIGCQHASNFDADGGNCAGGNTNLRAAGAVSAISARERTLFLTGVFLGDGAAAPASGLNFSDAALGRAFDKLAPALGQSFFIGDGLTGTGSGSVQHFTIPSGATRLYLGIVDGIGFQGDPGAYADNTGSIVAHLVQVAN